MQLTKHQIKKKKKGLCVASRCCRSRYDRFNFCHKHTKERYKQRNPERYTYTVLKNNAKRRGKEFDLSFDQFKVFLKKNPNYMKKKGTSVKALQIDRIDSTKGYTFSNIRAITTKENARKARLDKIHQQGGCPF